MGALRKHWSNEPHGASGLYVAVCGWLIPGQQIAKRIEDTDCRRCKKKLAQPGPDICAEYVAEKFEIRPLTEYAECDEWKITDPCVDEETGLPILSPETWRMASRCNLDRACGHCDVCQHFRGIDLHPSDRDSYRRPGSTGPDCRIDLGSIERTLTWYADWMECGQHAKSGFDWITRLEGVPAIAPGETVAEYHQKALALLSVSHGAVYDEESNLANAIRKLRVEQVLSMLYRDGGRLPRIECLRVLFARVVGVRQDTSLGPRRFPMPAATIGERFGITAGQVSAIVRKGREGYLMAIRKTALDRGASK